MANVNWILLFRDITIFSRNPFEFTIWLANSLWIHYLIRKFSSNPLSILGIHFKITILFANSLRVPYIFREYTTNSLLFSKIHFQFTIYFANLHWIPLLCEYTLNLLSFSRIRIDSTTFLSNPLSIHNLFREFTMKIHYLHIQTTMVDLVVQLIEFAYIRPLNMVLILMRVFIVGFTGWLVS